MSDYRPQIDDFINSIDSAALSDLLTGISAMVSTICTYYEPTHPWHAVSTSLRALTTLAADDPQILLPTRPQHKAHRGTRDHAGL